MATDAVASNTLTGFGSGIKVHNQSPLHLHDRSHLDANMSGSPAENSASRKTKIVCTIGPTSCSREDLFRLADEVDPIAHFCADNLWRLVKPCGNLNPLRIFTLR